MDSVGAAPGFLTQPNRALVYDEGRMVPTSIVGEDGATPSPTPKFSDFVAMLNPLQNLPIVGMVYRQLTGDVPHPAARVLGGLIWGGPLGLFGAALSHIAEQVSGKSTTELVKSIFDGAPAVADASAAAAPTPAAGEPGAPRRLIPSTPDAIPAAAEPQAVRREAVPRAVAEATTTPAAPTQTAAADGRPRSPGMRDLAFYQAHAGARLPAASSATSPSGPQQVPQLSSFHRTVSPLLGPEPAAAAPASRPPPAIRESAPAPIAPTPNAAGADFAQRMLQGLERYRALNRAAEAQTPILDRVE